METLHCHKQPVEVKTKAYNLSMYVLTKFVFFISILNIAPFISQYQQIMSLPATFVKGFHDESSVAKMKYRPLGRTGLQVSTLSFGKKSH